MHQNNPQPQAAPRMLAGGVSSHQAHSRSHFGLFNDPNIRFRALRSKEFGGAFVRIMPSRDSHLPAMDQQYPASVMPYRDVTAPDEFGRPKFSNWAINSVSIYKYMGRSKEDIVSRRTLASVDGGADRLMTADPLIDLMQYCKDNQLKQFTEQQPGQKNASLNWPESPVFMTVQVVSQQQPVPQMFVTSMSPSAFKDSLKDTLDWPTSSLLAARQPQLWPDYAYGDVTSPDNQGLYGFAVKRNVAAREVWVIAFCDDAKNIPPKYAQYPTVPLSQQELLARPDLVNLDTWKIPTYQEVVDWIISDGFLPVELVRVVCGHVSNVSAGPSYAGLPTSAPVTMGHGGPSWAPTPAAPQGFPQQGGIPPAAPQGYPQAAPQGFPQQGGFPQAAPQGYPPAAPQGYPQPGGFPQPPAAPPQGFPQQGGFPQAAPPQGFPQQGGFPQAAPPPQGFPQQGGFPQAAPPQFPQAAPQGFPQPGAFPPAAPPQGFPQQGGFPQAAPSQGFPQQGGFPPAAPPQGLMSASPPAAAGFASAPPPMPPAPPAGQSFAQMEAAARQEPLVVTPAATARAYWVSVNGTVASAPVWEAELGAFFATAGPGVLLRDASAPAEAPWLTKDELSRQLTGAPAAPPAAPPAPAPTAAPFTAPVADTLSPLAAAELEQLKDLHKKLNENPGALDQTAFTVYANLQARAAANSQAIG